jgi:hypothetical protein
MTPSCEVELEVSKGVLAVRCGGLWTLETVDLFLAKTGAAITRYRASGGRKGTLRLLVDIRACPIHTREVAERLQRDVMRLEDEVERVALLQTASALQRAQSKRIGRVDKRVAFSDEAAALEWLRSDPLPLAIAS